MITEDRLLPGDKLPSERELSERLNVGRSSVREGLRALELIGLIETRRGEGTFLRDFTNHHLVELISTFILQDKQVKDDILETKALLEMDAIRLVSDEKYIHQLTMIKKKIISGDIQSDDAFYYHLIEISQNRLLLKIWQIINEYSSQLIRTEKNIALDKWMNLIDSMIKQDIGQAILIYDKIGKVSKQ